MTNTLEDHARDPSLIEKLRIPKDPEQKEEDETFFEKLGDEIEKHPIHRPGLRRG